MQLCRKLENCDMRIVGWHFVVIACLLTSISWAERPRLVVLLCYDQMRADRLEKIRPWLGQRGFLRLLREGAVAERCLFNYATTVTAAGHATIATGCNPWRHGIVDNDFVLNGRPLYATDDTLLGEPSARLLLVPTLGDYMRQANPASKVWSFSQKDRGAIFLAGHNPTGVCWLQPHVGLGSSRYYPPCPPWIAAFNRAHSPARYAGAVWNTSLRTPADTVPWEGQFPEGERYFPHRLPADTSSNRFWQAFTLTPYSVEWLFQAAATCIRTEQLGSDTIPDLLCISVSTTDFVGHLFGHDSREYAELLVACDRILAAFLDTLDQQIGRHHYVVVLTSDHGAASIPELERTTYGLDAGRILSDTLFAWVSQWMESVGMKGKGVIRYFFPPWIWLDSARLRESGWEFDKAAESLARWLSQRRGIAYALPRRSIEEGVDTGIVGLIRRSYRSDRCGDIALYPEERWIFGLTPAQHGTPYEYDRWVPLVLFGGGILPQRYRRLCSPADIAPTIARLVGLPDLPCEGQPLSLSIAKSRQKTKHP